MEKLINIITRTSNRPKGFERNYVSIKNQKYKNYRHIVLYDDPKDYELYLKKYEDISLHFVNRNELIESYNGPIINDVKNFWPSEHNLYCNVGLDSVEEGYVIFLDDDDYMNNPSSLSQIVNHLEEDTLSVWQMQYTNGTKLPSDQMIDNQIITLGGIGAPCVGFHSKWKNSCKWDKYKCGDFRFIQCLSQTIPNKSFHKTVLSKIPQAGFGKRTDVL